MVLPSEMDMPYIHKGVISGTHMVVVTATYLNIAPRRQIIPDTGYPAIFWTIEIIELRKAFAPATVLDNYLQICVAMTSHKRSFSLQHLFIEGRQHY